MTPTDVLPRDDGSDLYGRPLAYTTLPVPRKVETDGDRIVWRGPFDEHESADDVLDRFLRLDAAATSAADVRDFASRFGVLRLCKDGLPVSHKPAPWNSSPSYLCHERKVGEWDGYESVEEWRTYARRIRAVLGIGARLHDGRLGDPADWKTLREPLGTAVPVLVKPSGLKNEREALARAVRGLLMLGDVRLGLIWPGASPVAELRGDLFGLIASQTMAAVGRWRGLYICSRCGYPFWIPTEGKHPRPRYGQRRYCATCRKAGAPLSDANYEMRRRKAR